MKTVAIISLLFFLGIFTGFAQQTYKIESSKSKVLFKIKNAGIQVDGSFSGVTGTIVFSPSALEKSSFQVLIPVSSINTGVTARDSHLKKEDYFNSATFPNMQFISKQIIKSGNGYLVKGTLTVKGKSKDVEMVFTFKEYPNSALFEGTMEINRLDFGVGDSSWVLSDVAKVSVNVWVTK